MAMHLFGLALSLKRARCYKAFRLFRAALANADAFENTSSNWIDYPDTNRVIREEFLALGRQLGRDKRRNPEERARILYYAHSMRTLWYYFRDGNYHVWIDDFRYLDRQAEDLFVPISPERRP